MANERFFSSNAAAPKSIQTILFLAAGLIHIYMQEINGFI